MKQEVYVEKTYGREKKSKTEFNGVIKGVVVSALALTVFLGGMTPKAYASSFMDKFSQEPQTIEAVYMTEESIIRNLTITLDLLEDLKESNQITDQDLINLAVSLGQLTTLAKDTEHTNEIVQLLDRAENLVKGKYGAGMTLVLDAVDEVRNHFGIDYITLKDSKSGLVIHQFSDVGSNDWYYSNVTELVRLGAINGYEDGTFKPNNNISYAEYLKILACSLGAESKSYTKQEGDEWYSPYIAACYENGIIGSYEDIDFNASITRADAARFTEKALSHLKNETSKDTTNISGKIKDYNSFKGTSDEYYILQQYAKGILVGDDNGAFRPASNLTRAEASTIILRAVKPEIRQTISNSGETATTTEIPMVIQDGPYAGRMHEQYATEYDLKALETARFYREDGKLFVSIDLPELPNGFKWRYSIHSYNEEGEYVFGTYTSDTEGKTGHQIIEINSQYQDKTIQDIYNTTLSVSVISNQRKSMVSHKLSTLKINKVMKQDGNNTDFAWEYFDTSKIFNW